MFDLGSCNQEIDSVQYSQRTIVMDFRYSESVEIKCPDLKFPCGVALKE